MSISLDRRAALLGAGGLSLLGAVPAWAAAPSAVEIDRLGRMTLQVFINERGPFRFALDSAATMSLIADDLIETLQLTRDADVTLHTLLAGERARTVRAERLRCGALLQLSPRFAVGTPNNNKTKRAGAPKSYLTPPPKPPMMSATGCGDCMGGSDLLEGCSAPWR